MATINLGRIGLVLKGAYKQDSTYERLDVVTYKGASYAALQDVGKFIAPTNTAYWLQMSAKGDEGIAGLNGKDGAAGKDGSRGAQGPKGQDGKDGKSPLFRTLGRTLQCSINDGKTWSELYTFSDKATDIDAVTKLYGIDLTFKGTDISPLSLIQRNNGSVLERIDDAETTSSAVMYGYNTSAASDGNVIEYTLTSDNYAPKTVYTKVSKGRTKYTTTLSDKITVVVNHNLGSYSNEDTLILEDLTDNNTYKLKYGKEYHDIPIGHRIKVTFDVSSSYAVKVGNEYKSIYSETVDLTMSNILNNKHIFNFDCYNVIRDDDYNITGYTKITDEYDYYDYHGKEYTGYGIELEFLLTQGGSPLKESYRSLLKNLNVMAFPKDSPEVGLDWDVDNATDYDCKKFIGSMGKTTAALIDENTVWTVVIPAGEFKDGDVKWDETSFDIKLKKLRNHISIGTININKNASYSSEDVYGNKIALKNLRDINSDSLVSYIEGEVEIITYDYSTAPKINIRVTNPVKPNSWLGSSLYTVTALLNGDPKKANAFQVVSRQENNSILTLVAPSKYNLGDFVCIKVDYTDTSGQDYASYEVFTVLDAVEKNVDIELTLQAEVIVNCNREDADIYIDGEKTNCKKCPVGSDIDIKVSAPQGLYLKYNQPYTVYDLDEFGNQIETDNISFDEWTNAGMSAIGNSSLARKTRDFAIVHRVKPSSPLYHTPLEFEANKQNYKSSKSSIRGNIIDVYLYDSSANGTTNMANIEVVTNFKRGIPIYGVFKAVTFTASDGKTRVSGYTSGRTKYWNKFETDYNTVCDTLYCYDPVTKSLYTSNTPIYSGWHENAVVSIQTSMFTKTTQADDFNIENYILEEYKKKYPDYNIKVVNSSSDVLNYILFKKDGVPSFNDADFGFYIRDNVYPDSSIDADGVNPYNEYNVLYTEDSVNVPNYGIYMDEFNSFPKYGYRAGISYGGSFSNIYAETVVDGKTMYADYIIPIYSNSHYISYYLIGFYDRGIDLESAICTIHIIGDQQLNADGFYYTTEHAKTTITLTKDDDAVVVMGIDSSNTYNPEAAAEATAGADKVNRNLMKR